MINSNIKSTIEKILGRSLKSTEGIPENELVKTEKHLGIELPRPLRDLYLNAGNIPLLMNGFEHFAQPQELMIEDNKLIFLAENQNGLLWAIDLENPQDIFQSINEDEEETSEEEERIWYLEELPTIKFLTFILYFQCVMGEADYQEQTEGGFPFSASLDVEAYQKSKKAKAFIKSVKQEWEAVAITEEAAIFCKDDSILLYFTDELGNMEDMLLFATKQKAQLQKVVQEYGFEEV